MTHTIKVAGTPGVLVDADGRISPLPKLRAETFRARCSCGWKGVERSYAGEAVTDGRAHVAVVERT